MKCRFFVLLSLLLGGAYATHTDGVMPNTASTQADCAAPIGNMALRDDVRYRIVHGNGGDGSGTFIRVTDTSNVVFQLNRDGTINNVFAGVDPVIARMVNVTPERFYAEVQFTWAAALGATAEATCSSGAGTTRYWNVWLGSPTSQPGFVTQFNTTATPTGVAFLFTNDHPVIAAPTLTGYAQYNETPFYSLLTWTEIGGQIDGYNLTIFDQKSGSTTVVTFDSNTFEYRDSLLKTQFRNYTVHAWNGGEADGLESNLVSLRVPPRDLFGDSGSIYGSEGREALGASLGISGAAISFLYGLFFVVGLTITGFSIYRVPGSIIGGLGGLVFAHAFDFWPLWSIIFLLVLAGAAYVLISRRRQE